MRWCGRAEGGKGNVVAAGVVNSLQTIGRSRRYLSTLFTMSINDKSDTKVIRRRSSPSSVIIENDVDVLNSSTSDSLSKTSSSSTSSSISFTGIVKSTAVSKRFSRQSSLPWGHKPSPYIGASCFLFLLPIPLLLRACCTLSACLLGTVAITSYLSDHVYTGVTSYAHTFDRLFAPMAFLSNIYSTYTTCGIYWASVSLLAFQCHIWANYYVKKGMYNKFVLWHCLWHIVGVGSILACFMVNDVVGECWM